MLNQSGARLRHRMLIPLYANVRTRSGGVAIAQKSPSQKVAPVLQGPRVDRIRPFRNTPASSIKGTSPHVGAGPSRARRRHRRVH